jgi:uncharacterized Zn finger protein
LVPISCPKCQHVGGTLVVKSTTVITVRCARCSHTWAADMLTLPSEVQKKIPIRDDLRDR